MDKTDKKIIALIVGIAAIAVFVWGSAIYVLFHFIAKFW